MFRSDTKHLTIRHLFGSAVILTLVAFPAVLPGCAGHPGASSVAPWQAIDEDPGFLMQDRGEIQWQLTPGDTPRRGVDFSPIVSGYVHLAPEEVQCLAADRAPVAGLLMFEQQAILAESTHNRDEQCGAYVAQDVLASQAVQERNEQAGNALELYYRLAEAEYSAELLGESLAILEEALASAELLEATGLPLETGVSNLRDQQFQLRDQQIDLQRTIAELNLELKSLLGIDDADIRIWPAVELAVEDTPIDVHQAIAEAQYQRGDLASLRLLSDLFDQSQLPIVQQLLKQVSPLLGVDLPAGTLLRLFHHRNSDAEQDVRRAQLDQLAAFYRQRVATEVRSAVTAVRGRRRQIDLAREVVEQRSERVAGVRSKQHLGKATPVEVYQARLSEVRARRELVAVMTEWAIARARLREAQGLLAAECGYHPAATASQRTPSEAPHAVTHLSQ